MKARGQKILNFKFKILNLKSAPLTTLLLPLRGKYRYAAVNGNAHDSSGERQPW
jgi:hypothetical protein